MRKLALYWKIIIGMVLGVVFGLIASNVGLEDFTGDWIKPWGKVFINLLKLIAVPLILASLIKGVSSLADTSKLSRIGGKTIAIYLISTVVAVTIGLLLVNTIEPGAGFDVESVELNDEQEKNKNSKINVAQSVNDSGPLQPLVDIVPNNIFLAASDNRNMLQVIFFAILFGIAMVMLPDSKTKHVKGFFDGVNDIILQIVDMIMLLAPYGVFALMSGIVVDFGGSIDVFLLLGKYCLTVFIGLMIMVLFVYPLILKIFTRLKYKNFFKGIIPAQMLAFSTSSSAATLPVTMDRCENKLGVSKEISSFVLPLGATMNMDGTSLYQSIAAVFIAQAFGVSLGFTDQLTIVLTATLASIGAAAVPGAGIVMLIIVLESTPSIPPGIIEGGVALVLAVDRILDMFRTVVNVTGDATVSAIVASSEGQLKEVSNNFKD